MSAAKAEIKQGTAHEIGCKLDDQLDAARAQVGQFAGAVSGAASVATKLNALVSAIQQDIDEGKLNMPDNTLHLGGMMIHQIRRCIAVAESDARGFTNRKLQQEGVVRGLEIGVGTAKQVHDAEGAKVTRTPRAGKSRDDRREEIAARKPAKKKAAAKKKPAKKKAAKKKATTRRK